MRLAKRLSWIVVHERLDTTTPGGRLVFHIFAGSFAS